MPLLNFILIFFGLVIRNWKLAKTLFYDWDEGMYAQIAQEILKNKSLFTTFNGQIWLDKPPLSHTLIALVFSIFGRSEFWVRMIMIIVSFILLILIFLLAKKICLALFKKESKLQITIASLLPVLILASSPIFTERSILLNTDIFVAVSWVGYFLCWDSFLGKLFFLTFGVWSKSVLGFYPLLLDGINYIFSSYCHPEFISGSVLKQMLKRVQQDIVKIFLLIVVPSLWYIAGIIKFGNYFIENHFLSQVFKRLSVPIELHFGNKYYYFSYLWEKMGIINILFLIGYLLFGISILRLFIKEKTKIINSSVWPLILFILSPLPFIVLLTFMKTKIYWYVIIFLPLLTLTISYLYLKLKYPILKISLAIFIFIYFLINFISQTFLLKVDYKIPEKIKLAQCLSRQPGDKIAFLVDEDERKIQNFLEASHSDTTSSFYYGGSPSFVYYSQKKVDYYYNTNNWLKNYLKYNLAVISKKDLENLKNNLSIKYPSNIICISENWITFTK